MSGHLHSSRTLAGNKLTWVVNVLSAIIEHTNKVIYLEDDDIAAVVKGKLSLHRVSRRTGEDPVRAIKTLQMELQHIMKGQTGVIISSIII